MEHLARWIKKDSEQGCLFLANALFEIYAAIALLVVFGIGTAEGWTHRNPDASVLRLVAFGLSLVVAALAYPLIRRYRRRKGRVSLASLLIAANRNNLGEAIGPNASALEEAAADLEQAELLLPKTALDRSFAHALVRSGNDRIRRMLEVSIAAPARYGLTRAQSEVQFAEDGRWLAEFRRLVEQTRESSTPLEEDATLGHLRTLVDSRQEALAELKA